VGTWAAIGLGSNVGERERHLENATAELAMLGTVVGHSSWFETEPIGGPDQGQYLNAVTVIDTTLQPVDLLEALLSIERAEGRQRRERWGPRTLDLDLLLYGDQVIDRPGLTVPHVELTRRRFALLPLLEVWPDAALPDGTRLDTHLVEVADQRVDRVSPPDGATETLPPWAPAVLFLIVGMGAVVLWWLLGLVL
jgi:2-amino-4-hydroxy-6-hydroxymethyldihydropteridine diphosphokinase